MSVGGSMNNIIEFKNVSVQKGDHTMDKLNKQRMEEIEKKNF